MKICQFYHGKCCPPQLSTFTGSQQTFLQKATELCSTTNPQKKHGTNSWWINKPWHRNYSPLIHTFIMVLQNTNGDEFKANTFSEEIIKPYNATKTTPSFYIYFTLGCYRTWDTKHCQMMWCTTAMDCHKIVQEKNK